MKVRTKLLSKQKIILLIILILSAVLLYQLFFSSITINPVSEKDQMSRLSHLKEDATLSEFYSDGCSGNISKFWSDGIPRFSKLSRTFSEKFKDVENLPFEEACVTHDKAYHLGEGGYLGRLEADNKLREDILAHGVHNTNETMQLTGVKTEEEAIFIYELVADVFYRAVRLGGAPCTGKSYAWGYGHNNGRCE